MGRLPSVCASHQHFIAAKPMGGDSGHTQVLPGNSQSMPQGDDNGKRKKKIFYPFPLKDIFLPKKWVGPYSTLGHAPSKYRIFCVCRRRGTHRRSPKSDIFRTHLPT